MGLRISVVIPTYNRAALLPRAVESALAACAPGDEVLVVDDGSTDETAVALAPYRARIGYLALPHGGLAAARNAGLAQAAHALVAFLDSDDEFMADKLTLQRAVLARRPEVVMAISDFGHRSARGGERHHELARWTGDARGWDQILGPGEPFAATAPLPSGRAPFRVHIGDLYPLLVTGSYAAPLTAVIRRDLIGAGPWFPHDLTFHCDTEGLARIARCGPVAFLDCETAWNWGHDGPRLTDISRDRYWTEYLTVLERLWGQDEAFLARHGSRYRAAMANAHRQRARWLIAEGRTREARGDLRAIGGAPVERCLAALPGWAIPARLGRRLRQLRHLLRKRRSGQGENRPAPGN